MNNNFDNGMNPVGGVSPTPVPNNVNPMTDNVLPTNPGYVDNGMLNNNVSEVPNVTPVVDNTIASVDNNITDDNKKKYLHLYFEDAYMVNMYQYFNNSNSLLVRTKVTLSARKFTFGGSANFENDWKTK